MSKLTTQKKEEIRARIKAFSFTGFKMRLSTDICKYTRSLVGRDFKELAQMALFVLMPYIEPPEKPVWLELSKVHIGVTCLSHYITNATHHFIGVQDYLL